MSAQIPKLEELKDVVFSKIKELSRIEEFKEEVKRVAEKLELGCEPEYNRYYDAVVCGKRIWPDNDHELSAWLVKQDIVDMAIVLRTPPYDVIEPDECNVCEEIGKKIAKVLGGKIAYHGWDEYQNNRFVERIELKRVGNVQILLELWYSSEDP